MTTQQTGSDALTAFWRDWFTKMQSQAGAMPGAGHAGAQPGHSAPGQPNWPMTPEALKQMQTSYLDALAKYCDQHMRSPQFLEAMKKSLDQALDFRKQVDAMLKNNATAAFSNAVTGGANDEILIAIRQSESRLNERLGDLSERVAKIEGGGRRASRTTGTKKSASKAGPGKSMKKKKTKGRRAKAD